MNAAEHSRTVAELVRAGDRDRYLATLFAPKPKRPALLALYGFNVELARAGEAVSEPMLGEIRLQWWRDALAVMEQGENTGHPVADALGEALRAGALSKPLLQGLIDARAFDISATPMPDMAALKAYLNKTAGALFALSAGLLADAAARPDKASEAAGLAFGLTGLMRALPTHAARGRLYLPASRFASHGLAPDALVAGQAGPGLGQALSELRAEARAALGRARAALDAVPRAAWPAFLPLALVEPYLRALEGPDHDPLHEIADIGPAARVWRLTVAAMRGQV